MMGAVMPIPASMTTVRQKPGITLTAETTSAGLVTMSGRHPESVSPRVMPVTTAPNTRANSHTF